MKFLSSTMSMFLVVGRWSSRDERRCCRARKRWGPFSQFWRDEQFHREFRNVRARRFPVQFPGTTSTSSPSLDKKTSSMVAASSRRGRSCSSSFLPRIVPVVPPVHLHLREVVAYPRHSHSCHNSCYHATLLKRGPPPAPPRGPVLSRRSFSVLVAGCHSRTREKRSLQDLAARVQGKIVLRTQQDEQHLALNHTSTARPLDIPVEGVTVYSDVDGCRKFMRQVNRLKYQFVFSSLSALTGGGLLAYTLPVSWPVVGCLVAWIGAQ